jgi:ParB family chromosome partitioning protein
VRIERGFIRVEDEKPEMQNVSGEGEGGNTVNDHGGAVQNGIARGESMDGEDEDADDHKPLSDILIRDLTAHRTLGLRLALSEQPEVAVIVVIHTLVAQIFYRGADAVVLDIRPAARYWLRMRTALRIPRRGRLGRITTLVGRRRCRVT